MISARIPTESIRAAAPLPSATRSVQRNPATRNDGEHLEQTGDRIGLQTMCEGGGTANATLIERM